jgi:hypothetical protein
MFIIKLSISTCFRHHYTHHQENKTVYYCIWCSAWVCRLWLAVVLWSRVVSCVHCMKVTVRLAGSCWRMGGVDGQLEQWVTVQNTICDIRRSCSPNDGHNSPRYMLRKKFDYNIWLFASCLFLLLQLTARSQEPKKRLQWKSNTRCKFNDSFLQKNHAANEITWEIWHSRTDQRWRYTKHALCMLDN